MVRSGNIGLTWNNNHHSITSLCDISTSALNLSDIRKKIYISTFNKQQRSITCFEILKKQLHEQSVSLSSVQGTVSPYKEKVFI